MDTWETLFDRATAHDVPIEAIRDALRDVRGDE